MASDYLRRKEERAKGEGKKQIERILERMIKDSNQHEMVITNLSRNDSNQNKTIRAVHGAMTEDQLTNTRHNNGGKHQLQYDKANRVETRVNRGALKGLCGFTQCL